MSGLIKKTVYADKVLATLLGVKEGTHVSYAELSKGLHKYIREKDLKKPPSVTPQLTPSVTANQQSETGVEAASRYCRECGMAIPLDAVFCDLCGVRQ